MTVIDECQTYLDLAQHKGDRALEGLARRCIALIGELIRKGRSVLCLTILATQKTTGDSIPTSLRDNSGLAVSFALKTTESSVAALGDAIREYPGYSPTLLRETPTGIGTAVATLTTGTDPFTRLRVPEITEQWAAATRRCHRMPPARPANARADRSRARAARPVTTRQNGVTAMPKAIDRLLTFDEAAELLGTSPNIPRRLVAERKIRFVRVGSRVRIPESAIHAYIAAGTVEPVTAWSHRRRRASDMPGRKTRTFGSLRQLPSGKWQARYRGPDGVMYTAPGTFPLKTRRRPVACHDRGRDPLRQLDRTRKAPASRSPITRRSGSRNGPACGPRRSSSTATCCAGTSRLASPRSAIITDADVRRWRADLIAVRRQPRHHGQGLPAAESDPRHRRRGRSHPPQPVPSAAAPAPSSHPSGRC